jgi:hypothetical protein
MQSLIDVVLLPNLTSQPTLAGSAVPAAEFGRYAA